MTDPLQLKWRQINDAIEQYSSEQHDRIRQVFRNWRHDSLLADQRMQHAVEEAMSEAHHHDKCHAAESKLKADMTVLVKELNRAMDQIIELQEQIKLLKREREIDKDLGRVAVQELARRRRHDAELKLTAKPADGGPPVVHLDQPLESLIHQWVLHHHPLKGRKGGAEQEVVGILRSALDEAEMQASFKTSDYNPTAKNGATSLPAPHSRSLATTTTVPITRVQSAPKSRRLPELPPEARIKSTRPTSAPAVHKGFARPASGLVRH
ncbi:hypothetical protein BC828DRAFT_438062 [Blastocladiella britannica]|nr:hypothetical protein BC828DRAFT_438062 [Blastocladiella britannica]